MLKIADIARVAHEANRAYCLGIGDSSQPAWEDAPLWQRESAAAGIQFVIDNPTAGSEQQHEQWLADKTRDGWKWGAVKNVETKENPAFCPYGELPPAQRAKDALFQATVRALIPFLSTNIE